MSDIEIVDNFLPEESFQVIKSVFLGDMFPWYLNKKIVELSEEHPLYGNQFTHTFYLNKEPTSGFYKLLEPLINAINPSALLRVKANLIPVRPINYSCEMHVDFENFDGFTSIYYVNTTDGKTLFENGESVDSIENRLVTFPSTMFHAGQSSTNTPYRCVININYYKWAL